MEKFCINMERLKEIEVTVLFVNNAHISEVYLLFLK